MSHYILLFILMHISWTLVTSEDLKTCFDEKIGNSVCKCEYIYFPEHLDLQDFPPETKLTCIGEDSLEVAIEVLTFKKHLIISDLCVSNGSFEVTDHNDLQHFPNLKNLSLANNQITTIGEGAFKNQISLNLLDLSSNNLTTLSNSLFEPLKYLKNLSLSSNQIHTIESKAFNDLHNLVYLDLSGNQLSGIDGSLFSGMKSLQYLFLSNNKVAYLNGSFHLLHLQQLDLSYNFLKIIPSSVFFRLKNLKFLSLAMNELMTLNESAFKGNGNLEKVNLTGNMWICDRKLLPLNEWLKKYEAYKEGALCMEPPELHNYTVQHGLGYIHLEVQIEENPTCNKTMCNCSISKDKLVITVDCSSRGFTRLPEFVPHRTRLLNLHDNHIKSLTVDHIDANQWSDVSFLYLNNNVIDSLKGLEGTWLLRNLVALHLSDNRLTEIPIHILEQFKGGNLDELYLSGNPWNCDCGTVRFQTWLQDFHRAVRDFEHIGCSRDSGVYANQPLYRLKKSQLCPQQVQLVNYLDVLNSLMAIAIFLIIVKLSYDYWLQKRTGKLPRFFSLNLT